MTKKTLPLTDFDLSQMNDDWLSLRTQAEVRELLARTLHELRAARDRLNQTPSNSSKPPSSRGPWERNTPESPLKETVLSALVSSLSPASEAKPAEQLSELKAICAESSPAPAAKPPSGKKAGKQPGAKGFGRKQRLAHTNTEHHHPGQCAGCGRALAEVDAQAYTAWDQIDIAERAEGQLGFQLEVTRNRLYAIACVCGHVTRATPHAVVTDDPLWHRGDLGQGRLIGPRLAGTIVFLALRMRLSRARIRELLIELFDVQLSIGVIDEAVREAGLAVAPLEDELVRDIEAAALLHVDESPWKESGQLLWLWVFTVAHTTLFLIGSRSLEILSNVLTNRFTGNLMSDGYAVYRHLNNRLRCWAHLMRKLQGLVESTDPRVARAGKCMQTCFVELMRAIYRARDNPDPKAETLLTQQSATLARLRQGCERHEHDAHDKLRAVAREFLLDWDVIIRQVAEPHLPLTNNAAEQALRHWVITRRISHGTRSEAGTRAFALLASVIETCRKRSTSSRDFIGSVIAAARAGTELPTLPVIRVGV